MPQRRSASFAATLVGLVGSLRSEVINAMKKMLLAGIALLAVCASAHATEDFCAVVLRAPDGFLALRAEPGTQSKMLTKLHEGDFLYADTQQCSQSVCDKRWTHVIGVPRIDGPDDPKKTYEDYTRGWVFSRYIQSFLCPENQAEQAKAHGQ
jgi:hypothetical protein